MNAVNVRNPNSERDSKLNGFWTEFLTKSPTPDQLLDVARAVPYLQERAWNMWIETNPDEQKLVGLFSRRSGYWHMKKLIGAAIIKRFPTKASLLMIIQEAPELGTEVANALCEQEPCDHSIWEYIIMTIGDDLLREKVARKYFERQLSNRSLCVIASHVPSLCEKACEKLLSQDPKGDEIVTIMRDCPTCALTAWELARIEGSVYTLMSVVTQIPEYSLRAGKLLLEKTYKPEELFNPMFHIAKSVPQLREAVWKRLQKVQLSNTWLEAIAREAPELSTRALALRVPPERTAEVVMSDILRANY